MADQERAFRWSPKIGMNLGGSQLRLRWGRKSSFENLRVFWKGKSEALVFDNQISRVAYPAIDCYKVTYVLAFVTDAHVVTYLRPDCRRPRSVVASQDSCFRRSWRALRRVAAYKEAAPNATLAMMY